MPGDRSVLRVEIYSRQRKAELLRGCATDVMDRKTARNRARETATARWQDAPPEKVVSLADSSSARRVRDPSLRSG